MHEHLQKLLEKAGLDIGSPPQAMQWVDFIETLDRRLHKNDQRLSRARRIAREQLGSFQQREEVYQSRLEAILFAFPDLLVLLDEDGVNLEILAGDDELLYQPASRMIGRTLEEIFPPQESARFMRMIQHALETGEMQRMQYPLMIRHQERWFEGRMLPAGYEINGKQTLLYLARDITQNQKAAHHERLLDNVLASANEGIVIVNPDRRILYANEAVARMTGFSREELMHEGEGFLRHELDQPVCDEVCAMAITGSHLRMELQLHHRDGSETPILLSMNTIRNEAGEIEYFVGTLTDVSDIKKTQQQLEHSATHDVLTGLPNRHLLEQRLHQVIARLQRHGGQGSLLFLDLDRFKNINDSLGHSVGDELLVQAAERLSSLCRSEDTVARFGGDEFVILTEDSENEEAALSLAQKIVDAFRQPFRIQSYQLNVSTSIGITLFPHEEENVELLLKQADAAMYAAKAAGRNGYRLYAHEYLESAMAGLTLESELRRAVENEEFLLYFQPQYSLITGRLSGFEALIRWQHPERGLLLPGTFIPAAESTGLIEEIGLWVFQEVCRRVVDWNARGLPFERISFNLSQRQLLDSNFGDLFLALLEGTGALPLAHHIECEITESLIIKQLDILVDSLNRLKQVGMTMAIDDFGTGHSSLVNLKRYPLDRLKIDREFVRDIGKDKSDEGIINATLALAQGFGLEVVAEGVENELQKAFLKEMGCHEIQGFLLSRPMSVDDCETLLMAERQKHRALV